MTDRPIWQQLPARPVSADEIIACLSPEFAQQVGEDIAVRVPEGSDAFRRGDKYEQRTAESPYEHFLVFIGDRVQYLTLDDGPLGWRREGSVPDEPGKIGEPHAALQEWSLAVLGSEIARARTDGTRTYVTDRGGRAEMTTELAEATREDLAKDRDDQQQREARLKAERDTSLDAAVDAAKGVSGLPPDLYDILDETEWSSINLSTDQQTGSTITVTNDSAINLSGDRERKVSNITAVREYELGSCGFGDTESLTIDVTELVETATDRGAQVGPADAVRFVYALAGFGAPEDHDSDDYEYDQTTDGTDIRDSDIQTARKYQSMELPTHPNARCSTVPTRNLQGGKLKRGGRLKQGGRADTNYKGTLSVRAENGTHEFTFTEVLIEVANDLTTEAADRAMQHVAQQRDRRAIKTAIQQAAVEGTALADAINYSITNSKRR